MKKKSKKLISEIEKESKEFFAEKSDGCHDWSHVERVRKIALHIGKAESADLFVLEAAALMHDIGRNCEVESKGKVCHAKAGAELAVEILKRLKIEENVIESIFHCIIAHRNRTTEKPQTLEAKILFDADKLDSIGAVGIGRVFMYAGITSGVLCTGNEKRIAASNENVSFTSEDTAPHEYEKILKHIKDKMLTKEGKRMAKARHLFMKNYFDRFWKEVNGDL